MSPLLTLVTPTGMTQPERKAWLHAAYQALGDVAPADLASAVKAAMATVDHPSKIVPAIRKWLAERPVFKTVIEVPTGMLPEPPREVVPFEETQAIIRRAREAAAARFMEDAA